MVEAAGIEPASKEEEFKEPTCVVSDLISDEETPADGFISTHAYWVSPFLIGVWKNYPAIMTPCSDLKQEEGPDDVAALGS